MACTGPRSLARAAPPRASRSSSVRPSTGSTRSATISRSNPSEIPRASGDARSGSGIREKDSPMKPGALHPLLPGVPVDSYGVTGDAP